MPCFSILLSFWILYPLRVEGIVRCSTGKERAVGLGPPYMLCKLVLSAVHKEIDQPSVRHSLRFSGPNLSHY